MPLVIPQFVVLDSATLGKVSRDYWSPEQTLRGKARLFLARLVDQSVHITVTFTHVCELLRHNDESVVRERLAFLRALPLIAWLRPYDRNWFPGDIPDLLRKELHAVVHDGKRDWRTIIEHVRADLWETGTGSEMFVDDDHLWSVLRQEFQRQQRSEQYVASVARTDPGNINDLKVGEAKQLPRRPKAERVAFMRRFFTAAMKAQLEQHGDLRLERPHETAAAFADERLDDLELYEAAGGDPIQRMLEYRGVPAELVTDDMTVGDVGALAVYVKQLKLLCENLCPQATVSIRDVPPDTLPSYVLEHRLAAIQRKAARVSGSDLGDGHIAPLALYADAVEVDKRTREFLTQVLRADATLAGLMRCFFRSADYAEIPDHCANRHPESRPLLRY